MAKTTVIRNARWTIVWNGKEHVYLRGADVAFSSPLITHVGRRYLGPADREIDGTDRLVMPGLINIYENIQFTKAPNVLRGMGLSQLSKNEKAMKELTEKGMALN